MVTSSVGIAGRGREGLGFRYLVTPFLPTMVLKEPSFFKNLTEKIEPLGIVFNRVGMSCLLINSFIEFSFK